MNRLSQVKNSLNLLFLWTKVDVSRLEKSFLWCRRPDSNRHVFLRLILNQLRLPISPLRHGKDTENVLDYTCHWLLRKRQSAIAALSVEKNSASRISANIQYVPQVNPSFSPFPLAVSSFSESARKILQTAQFGLHFRQFVIRSCY